MSISSLMLSSPMPPEMSRAGLASSPRSIKISISVSSTFTPALNRLAQPLHGELNILRLKFAPALDFSLEPLFREALEIFRGQLFCGRALPGEFLADKGVSWHRGF